MASFFFRDQRYFISNNTVIDDYDNSYDYSKEVRLQTGRNY